MAIELEQYLQEQLERLPEDHPDRKFLLKQLGVVKGYDSSARESLPTTELDIENERQRQANELARFFAEELRMTREEYIASLPQFTSQPEAFKCRFNIPVIVETRVSPKRQCELAGINPLLDTLECQDWSSDPKDYRTPDTPYVTWMNDGRPNLNTPVMTVREILEDDERGGTIFDGIALYIVHPKILKDHFLDLPGTQFGLDKAPYLFDRDGQPRLYYRKVDGADSSYGSVVCGRA